MALLVLPIRLGADDPVAEGVPTNADRFVQNFAAALMDHGNPKEREAVRDVRTLVRDGAESDYRLLLGVRTLLEDDPTTQAQIACANLMLAMEASNFLSDTERTHNHRHLIDLVKTCKDYEVMERIQFSMHEVMWTAEEFAEILAAIPGLNERCNVKNGCVQQPEANLTRDIAGSDRDRHWEISRRHFHEQYSRRIDKNAEFTPRDPASPDRFREQWDSARERFAQPEFNSAEWMDSLVTTLLRWLDKPDCPEDIRQSAVEIFDVFDRMAFDQSRDPQIRNSALAAMIRIGAKDSRFSRRAAELAQTGFPGWVRARGLYHPEQEYARLALRVMLLDEREGKATPIKRLEFKKDK